MNIHALLQRARDCDRLGQDESAKSAYVEYLKEKPDDLGALTDLGNLALRTGYRSAARTAYERVLQIDPNNCVARVNLGNVLLDASELPAARSHYEAALIVDPHFAAAHQGLSYVYARLGDEAASSKHRLLGFRGNAYTHIPYRGTSSPVRAVVLISAAGGNFNTDRLLHDHNVDVFKVAAEYADPDRPLPPHEVLVNAIGDADLSHEGLTAAIRMCARSSARIVNAPGQVLKTARIANAHRLQALPDVVTPRMCLLSRERLPANDDLPAALGFGYPILLRTPGHHTGRHFLKLESAQDIPHALASLPGDDLLAIEYLDVRDPDGWIRKYRMMIVGAQLLPAHAAISRDWKVHFVTADMADNEHHRAEDARFIEDPHGVLAPAAFSALTRIAELMQLDYAGVDFRIDASGRLVVFEANAAMSIVPPHSDRRWDYRRGAIERIFTAFDRLIRTQ